MVLIFDSTVLMNFIDHCPVPDVIGLLLSYPFELEIVSTVESEYLNGLRSRPFATNSTRFYHYVPQHIKVVADSTFPASVPTALLGLHRGELMSAVYKLQNPESRILCTDDKAVHLALQNQCGKKCLWTSDLLVLIHQRKPSLIRQRDARAAYRAIISCGFIGIPPNNIDFTHTYNLNTFL